MRLVRLRTGDMVFQAVRTVTVTPFDLRAVLAGFLSKGVMPRDRRHLLAVAVRLLERRGEDGIMRLSKQVELFHESANVALLRLFPEVANTNCTDVADPA